MNGADMFVRRNYFALQTIYTQIVQWIVAWDTHIEIFKS